MLRRIAAYAVPVVILAGFLAVMISDEWLRGPFSADDDVQAKLERLQQAVIAGDWEGAAREHVALEASLRRVIGRVQFSIERDQINRLRLEIAGLGGAIAARDSAAALVELSEAAAVWQGLGQ
ncbi:MAG TPA: hypothetical protein VF234_10945 [Limnochordia bacterium]